MARTHRLVAVALIGSACAPDSARVQPSVESRDGIEIAVLDRLPDFFDSEHMWSWRVLREIETVRPGEEPLVFNPSALLELSDGNLLVHDPTAELVFALLDSNGRSALHRFGREGQGPGELGSSLSVRESAGEIAILDAENRQMHRYSVQGEVLGSSHVSLDGMGRKSLPAVEGGGFLAEVLYLEEDHWYRALVQVGAEGTVAPLARLPEPSDDAAVGRIQQGRVVWTVVGRNLVAMWSARPEVFVYQEDGSVLRKVELPLVRRDLSDRDIAAQIEHYGEIARLLTRGSAALTNDLYPVNDTIFGMYTSQLWKAESDPDLEVGRVWWRLFTVRGEYIGVVALPDEMSPLGPSPNGIWARVLNERGEPIIQELELVRRGVT